ncbi:MAG: hypothetical protein ACTSUE_19480 [Promethearchaeota archaeon]
MDKKQGLAQYIKREIHSDLGPIAAFNLVLATKSEGELSRVLGIEPGASARLLKHAMDTTGDIEILTHAALLGHSHLHPSKLLFPTRIKPLDEVFGGGLMEGEVYQIYGPMKGAINSFLYFLALSFINSQPDKEKLRVVFIDTDMSFRPEHIIRLGGKEEDLEKILVSRCFGEHTPVILMGLLDYFEKVINDEYYSPLLVVNSILPISLLLLDNVPFERQKAVVKVLSRIRSLARDRGTCVLIGNHASADSMHVPGGNTMVEYSDHVFYLSKNQFTPDTFAFELRKSTFLPMKRVSFRFTPRGLQGDVL